MKTGIAWSLFALLMPVCVFATTLRLSTDIDLLVLDGKKVSSSLLRGADSIELYTGPYAEAWANGDAGAQLALFAAAARRAQAVGLGVNAGHDLSQANLADFLAGVPGVLEVSIGHALIGESLYDGLEPTVRAYLDVIGQGG